LKRYTRCQGAIVQNHHILLIKHREHKTGRSYWIFPGGGIESGETEEECVQREMKGETNLDVRVLPLLVDQPSYPGDVYQQLKTYHCEPSEGKASPGFEPEPEAASHKALLKRGGLTCAVMRDWDPLLVNNPIIYLPLQRFRRKLGYLI
jgi:8-oxo-dGTP diphosphatase